MEQKIRQKIKTKVEIRLSETFSFTCKGTTGWLSLALAPIRDSNIV